MKSPEISVEQIDAFAQVFNEYITCHELQSYLNDFVDKLSNNFDLFPRELLHEVPAATVTIPVRLPVSKTEDVLHTLRLIQRAAHQTGPLEVVLWANNQIVDSADLPYEVWEWEIDMLARVTEEAYHELIEAVREEKFDPTLIRVRPALEYTNSDSKMLEIRRNYMDVVGYDAFTRDFPFSHPVIWLDADMTVISQDAILAMVDRLNNDRSTYIVKPNLFFTGQPAETTPLSEREPSEKYAALYAMARKILERNSNHTNPGRYIEECGLGMRLGDYFVMDGLRPALYDEETTGETARLEDNAFYRGLESVYTYESKARFGTSYRNFQTKAKRLGPAANFPKSLSTSHYLTYSELKVFSDANNWRNIEPDIPESQAWKLVDDLAATYQESYEPPLTEKQRRILGKIVARLNFTVG